jgi:hypothetical protein
MLRLESLSQIFCPPFQLCKLYNFKCILKNLKTQTTLKALVPFGMNQCKKIELKNETQNQIGLSYKGLMI